MTHLQNRLFKKNNNVRHKNYLLRSLRRYFIHLLLIKKKKNYVIY